MEYAEMIRVTSEARPLGWAHTCASSFLLHSSCNVCWCYPASTVELTISALEDGGARAGREWGLGWLHGAELPWVNLNSLPWSSCEGKYMSAFWGTGYCLVCLLQESVLTLTSIFSIINNTGMNILYTSLYTCAKIKSFSAGRTLVCLYLYFYSHSPLGIGECLFSIPWSYTSYN